LIETNVLPRHHAARVCTSSCNGPSYLVKTANQACYCTLKSQNLSTLWWVRTSLNLATDRTASLVPLAPVKDMDHGRRQRTNDDAMTSELQIEERAW